MISWPLLMADLITWSATEYGRISGSLTVDCGLRRSELWESAHLTRRMLVAKFC